MADVEDELLRTLFDGHLEVRKVADKSEKKQGNGLKIAIIAGIVVVIALLVVVIVLLVNGSKSEDNLTNWVGGKLTFTYSDGNSEEISIQ